MLPKLSLCFKKEILFLIFILSAFILFIYSCRKNEYSYSKPEVDVTFKFFSASSTLDETTKAVLRKIKAENQDSNFVPDLVKRIGYPIWDKTVTGKNLEPVNYGRSTGRGDDSTILYIPFSKENSRIIDALLIAKIKGTDTTLKIIYKFQYKNYPWGNTTNGTWSAGDVFHIFSYFDHHVYGTYFFRVTDKRLISYYSSYTPSATKKYYLRIKDERNGARTSLAAFTFWECYTYGDDGDEGQVVGVEPGGTNDYPDIGEACYGTTIWYEDGGGGGGTSNPIPTSGGGGGGWWTDPCAGGRTAPGDENPCGTAGGWIPVSENGDPLLDYFNLGINHLSNEMLSPKDFNVLVNWNNGVNIDTSSLDNCRKAMLGKMLSTTHALGRLFIKLDRALKDSTYLGKFNIKYTITNNLPGNTVAKADNFTYDSNTKMFHCTVFINNNYVNQSTDLFLSQSIMHESMHAYLTYILARIQNGANLSTLQTLGYHNIFDAYADTLIHRNPEQIAALNTPNSQFQHNWMADHLLNFMANSLEEFDDNRLNDQEYYWYLSWSGLYYSQAWLDHWPNMATYPNPGWDNITNPALNNDDKQGFKYALTTDRLGNILNALTHEGLADSQSKGKKPNPSGNNPCYQ